MAPIILLLLCFWALHPVLQNGWTNWDDKVYITENPLIRDASLSNLGKLFLPENKTMDTYTPLTLVSFALEYSFVELDPFLYHLDNLILHFLNILLVFFIIRILSPHLHFRVAFFVAFLFGTHPMHVESVAWVTERKDTLFGFFFLLAILFYQLSQRKGRERTAFKSFYYWLAILGFILSMLSKPQAACLPVVLLLFDWYKWEKLNLKLILEKLPFFAIALFFGLLAMNQMMPSAGYHSLWDRILLSSYATFLYIQKLFVPIPVSAHYPFPEIIDGKYPLIVYLSLAILLIVTVVITLRRKKNRNLFFGFAFFIITLGFTLHFIKVNSAIIYDRFTYISYIGLFLPIFILLNNWLETSKMAVSKIIVSLLFLFIMASYPYVSYLRTQEWKDSFTLWESTIRTHPHSHMAYGKRADYWLKQDNHEKALRDYITCTEKKPDFPECQNNAGLLLYQSGRLLDAMPYFDRAIEADSTFWRAWLNRALLCEDLRLFNRTIDDVNQALKLKPDLTTALMLRAIASEKMGKLEDALQDYNLLLSKEPNNAGLFTSRGLIHFKLGNPDKGLIDYNRAILLNPRYANAYYRRSKLYFYRRQFNLAMADALKAQELGFDVHQSYFELIKEQL